MTDEEERGLIQGRLNTRESSTLTIATVASSASLVVLSIAMTNNGLLARFPWLPQFGIVFAVLGFLYREITVQTADRWDFTRLWRRLPPNVVRPKWLAPSQFFRALIVRSFIYPH